MPTVREKRLAIEAARRAILQQWQQRYVSRNAQITNEMYIFYGWLREARPNLLESECLDIEPWQVIQEWLKDYERCHPRR